MLVSQPSTFSSRLPAQLPIPTMTPPPSLHVGSLSLASAHHFLLRCAPNSPTLTLHLTDCTSTYHTTTPLPASLTPQSLSTLLSHPSPLRFSPPTLHFIHPWGSEFNLSTLLLNRASLSLPPPVPSITPFLHAAFNYLRHSRRQLDDFNEQRKGLDAHIASLERARRALEDNCAPHRIESRRRITAGALNAYKRACKPVGVDTGTRLAQE